MMQTLIAPLILMVLLVTGCGAVSDDVSDPPPPAVGTSSNVPHPGVTTNASDEMAFVLKRYRRIEEMEGLGMLHCESIGYDCAYDPGGGSFRLCYLDKELVRATHDYARGNHGGGSETYYYDGGSLFLADLSSSSWSFTERMQTNQEGQEAPGTEEVVHEERRYYHANNMIDRVYKDYRIRSWQDAPDPASIPEQQTGTGVDDGIGSEVMLQVARRGKYECE